MNFLSVADKYRKAYPKEEFEITLWVSNHLEFIASPSPKFANIKTFFLLVLSFLVFFPLNKHTILSKKYTKYLTKFINFIMGI